MSKEEFSALQRDCLSVCFEIQKIGDTEAPVPVMTPSGAWGVAGLEDDTVTVLVLTARAIAWNISGFFDGSALKGLMTEKFTRASNS